MALAEVIIAAVPESSARLVESAGGPMLIVEAAAIAEVLAFLRSDPDHSYEMLVDISVVDHVADEGTFHVVYLLSSLSRSCRLVVKALVAADDPHLPSADGLWKSANWAEREAWDMFGVRFDGHPNLSRILMYEEFVGHPLRKDYPVDKRQPLIEERDPISDPWPSKDGL